MLKLLYTLLRTAYSNFKLALKILKNACTIKHHQHDGKKHQKRLFGLTSVVGIHMCRADHQKNPLQPAGHPHQTF